MNFQFLSLSTYLMSKILRLLDFQNLRWSSMKIDLEMFYLNTIDQLFLFVEQLDQLEVCLPNSRLLAGISTLAVFQNLRWNLNKISPDTKYLTIITDL